MRLNDLKIGSIVYLTKIHNGFIYTFGVEFLCVEKGMIKGTLKTIQPNDFGSIWLGKTFYKKGEVVSGRINNAYLRGEDNKALWFKKTNGTWQAD